MTNLTVSSISNIPSLRFPGFTRAWVEQKLGNLAEITSSKRVYLSDYVEHGVPFFRGKEITDLQKNNVPKDILFITKSRYEELKRKYGVPQTGDLLITSVGTLGNVYRVDLDYEFYFKDGNLIWLRNLKIDSRYLKLAIDYHKRELLKGVIGSTQKALTIIGIKDVPISVPESNEQRKIASFLSILDSWIENLRSQKSSLESYKKSIMQKIFSQEIRFKDDNGKDYPAWERKQIQDIFRFIPTNSFSRSQLNYNVGSVKNIHYGDIHTKLKANFDINTETLPYISISLDLSKISEETYCKVGDVVMVDASEDHKDIAKSIELINLDNQKVLAGLHTFLLRPLQKTYVGFFGYLMKTYTVHNELAKLATGISVLGLSKSNLLNVKLSYPCVSEQKKITDLLTSIDKSIESKQNQITKVELWKKGLIQRMFV